MDLAVKEKNLPVPEVRKNRVGEEAEVGKNRAEEDAVEVGKNWAEEESEVGKNQGKGEESEVGKNRAKEEDTNPTGQVLSFISNFQFAPTDAVVCLVSELCRHQW
jgi:hypothetical protein